MSYSEEKKDFDYSFYLGPDYKKTQQMPPKAPTIIVNHSSWFDNVVLIRSSLLPGFAAKIETKKVPVLRQNIIGLRSIFISRGASEEERAQIITMIHERQQKVLDDPTFPQICIYPEGTQTNGKTLIPFKKGAFFSMLPVTPVVIKYGFNEKGGVSPAWDCFPFGSHCFFLHAMIGRISCDITILPDFKPNEYLLRTHRDKGKEDWEIYAWAVRDIIAK